MIAQALVQLAAVVAVVEPVAGAAEVLVEEEVLPTAIPDKTGGTSTQAVEVAADKGEEHMAAPEGLVDILTRMAAVGIRGISIIITEPPEELQVQRTGARAFGKPDIAETLV